MHRSFANVNVAQGNHDISGHKGVILFNDQISILHFPYRRFSSYKSKIRLGGDAYRRNALLPRSLGKAWRVQRKVLSSQGLGEFGVGCRSALRAFLKACRSVKLLRSTDSLGQSSACGSNIVGFGLNAFSALDLLE